MIKPTFKFKCPNCETEYGFKTNSKKIRKCYICGDEIVEIVTTLK